jgi:hypothetical protein
VLDQIDRLRALARDLEDAEVSERWTDALTARAFAEAAFLGEAADRLDAMLAPFRGAE